MTNKATTIDVTWEGPFSWPTFESENNLPPIPKQQGVYLQTFEYQDGYLIYAAGITRRPVPARFREHTRKYMSGDYTILDVNSAQQGIRKEIWHGWEYAREHRDEFEENQSVILEAVRKQLVGFRVFVADVGGAPRIHERMESSIMNNLYKPPPPICDFPDRGMQLSSRWDSEESVVINSKCSGVLHGLPELLEI